MARAGEYAVMDQRGLRLEVPQRVMSRRNKVAACLFVTALSAGSAYPDLRAADLTVKLDVGQQDTIELVENLAAGHHWLIDAKASSHLSILRIEDLGFSKKAGIDDGHVGGFGYHRWTVEAVSGGTATIVFVEQLPSEAMPIHRHQVVIEVATR